MEDFHVLKLSGWRHNHWSHRVLTLCTAVGIATLTHDTDVESHAGTAKSLHISRVQLWPHYRKHQTHDFLTSSEAMLTLRITGVEVRGHTSVVNRAEGAAQVYHYTQRNTSSDEGVWMLRFRTYAEFEAAVHALHSIRVRSTADSRWEEPRTDGAGGAECHGDTHTAAEAAVDDGSTVVADDAQLPLAQDGVTSLTDELAVAQVVPNTVMEGDAMADLETIRLHCQ